MRIVGELRAGEGGESIIDCWELEFLVESHSDHLHSFFHSPPSIPGPAPGPQLYLVTIAKKSNKFLR